MRGLEFGLWLLLFISLCSGQQLPTVATAVDVANSLESSQRGSSLGSGSFPPAGGAISNNQGYGGAGSVNLQQNTGSISQTAFGTQYPPNPTTNFASSLPPQSGQPQATAVPSIPKQSGYGSARDSMQQERSQAPSVSDSVQSAGGVSSSASAPLAGMNQVEQQKTTGTSGGLATSQTSGIPSTQADSRTAQMDSKASSDQSPTSQRTAQGSGNGDAGTKTIILTFINSPLVPSQKKPCMPLCRYTTRECGDRHDRAEITKSKYSQLVR